MLFVYVCFKMSCSSPFDRRDEWAYLGVMRWDALFDDLEAQLQAAAADREGEIRERTRSEQSRLTLTQRLLGQVGRPLGVSTSGGRTVVGVLTNVGTEWIALAVDGRSVLVPRWSVQSLRGLGRAVGQPLGGVDARLRLGSVLRVLSRDRLQVAVWLAAPQMRYAGVIDRVGSDFLELGLVAPGDERRAANVRETLTLPFAAIDAIDSTAASPE